ncbi:MAG: YicC family protein [Limnochordales bacterium]|nr:YicC family protein [Limnochordales bacterium]
MLYSMTGYGEAMLQRAGYTLRAEIRSLNHRGFDWSARLPAILLPVEDRLRQVVHGYIHRGRVEISVTLEEFAGQGRNLSLNRPLAEALLRAAGEAIAAGKEVFLGQGLAVEEEARLGQWIWPWLLSFPGVVVAREERCDPDLEEAAVEVVAQAAARVRERRRAEGQRLEEELLQRLAELDRHYQAMVRRAPELPRVYRERLWKRWLELQPQAMSPEDEQALARELALLVDRSDIREEMVRLGAHLAAMRQALELCEPVGKRLDFLAQEINRELTTIASKAQDLEMAQLVVEAKAEVERVREQLANVE